LEKKFLHKESILAHGRWFCQKKERNLRLVLREILDYQ
jgi:hypothetical protein